MTVKEACKKWYHILRNKNVIGSIPKWLGFGRANYYFLNDIQFSKNLFSIEIKPNIKNQIQTLNKKKKNLFSNFFKVISNIIFTLIFLIILTTLVFFITFCISYELSNRSYLVWNII